MPIKVAMVSLGCPKNQVDAECMLSALKSDGFLLSQDTAECDVVIINTCGFIEDAKKESIENILDAAALKNEGIIKGIVITGCLSQRYFREMREEFPEVNCILQLGCNGDISKAVRAAYSDNKLDLEADPSTLPAGGGRVLTTPDYTAYLKIAEGCDNRCSYCIIPQLRGPFRSRPMDDLLREAEALADSGVRELVLVAQDTTRYGQDLTGELMLPQLLHSLCSIKKLRWIRLLYCYPDLVTDELIRTIAREEKVVKYLDLPIQHVNKRIVKAMNRRMEGDPLRALIGRIRAGIPGVTLRTTLIVGFPGETDEEFAELAEFVKEIKFDQLGVFAYSQEEGTPAAEFEPQIADDIKQRRKEILETEQLANAQAAAEKLIGRTLQVLCEGYDTYAENYYGRTAGDAPAIDGRVLFSSQRNIRPGSFVNVFVKGFSEYDLIGEAADHTKTIESMGVLYRDEHAE